MRRGQGLAGVVVLILLVGGAAYADREIGPRALGDGPEASVASGQWFCPHGGGREAWEVLVQVANPGDAAATIRIRTLGSGRPSEPQRFTVEPRSFLRVPVEAEGRERASMVEWFDQWVAVGWVAHAGGEESGVAAEPCAPAAGDRWLLPDGTSETDQNDDFVVVMNPFARDAVFSVALLSERSQPVISGELTDLALRPYRSRVIRLNDIVKGERTVSAIVGASIGRVVAGTLGVSGAGIRSATGYLGPGPQEVTFPGGDDAGRTDLVVMTTGPERVPLEADLLEAQLEQPFAGLADSTPPPESGRTFPATTAGATSVVFSAQGPGVAAVRRTFGVTADQGATRGAAPSTAWLVLPAVSGSPSHPGLVLANPGTEPATVTLTYLAPGPADTITVNVPPRSTVAAPRGFVEADPEGAVIAAATTGTFVPAASSYSRGREGYAAYAVGLGISIPEGWVPG